MKRSWFAALLAFAICGCSASPELRYRMTIAVDTPEGLKAGSSVWSWRIAKGGLDRPYNGRFRGEAIAVDLGARGMLFGLLVGRNADGKPVHGAMQLLPERTFGDTGRGIRGERKLHRDRVADVADLSKREGLAAELDCSATAKIDSCQFLVKFRDISDPSSVEAVNPSDLGSAFGGGVRLRRVTIEITDEPVTTGIDEIIPWLDRYRNLRFNGKRLGKSPELNAYLDSGYFSRMD